MNTLIYNISTFNANIITRLSTMKYYRIYNRYNWIKRFIQIFDDIKPN